MQVTFTNKSWLYV